MWGQNQRQWAEVHFRNWTGTGLEYGSLCVPKHTPYFRDLGQSLVVMGCHKPLDTALHWGRPSSRAVLKQHHILHLEPNHIVIYKRPDTLWLTVFDFHGKAFAFLLHEEMYGLVRWRSTARCTTVSDLEKLLLVSYYFSWSFNMEGDLGIWTEVVLGGAHPLRSRHPPRAWSLHGRNIDFYISDERVFCHPHAVHQATKNPAVSNQAAMSTVMGVPRQATMSCSTFPSTISLCLPQISLKGHQ